MFKTVLVFVAFLAVVYAKPGYLEYPAATSHASRVDIVHPQPIVKSYAVPYYGHGYNGYSGYGNGYGYGGYGYGGYGHGYGYPAATSYSNRVDYPSTPIAVSYGHGGYYGGYGHGYGGYGEWDY